MPQNSIEMSFLNKLFGSGNTSQSTKPEAAGTSATNLVSFGRYTDINKNKNQLAHWKKSNDLFKEKDYLGSYEAFFTYLRDDKVDNVNFKREGDKVTFEITQGSKVVKGQGDKERFYAEANIVIMEDHSMPVMRKLMNLNYAPLRYSKFALNGDVLVLKFSSHSLDASPGKLYDALKELCKKADQQDDLLMQEFSSLKEIDTDSIIAYPPEIQEAKYEYLIGMIHKVKEEIAKHDANQMSGGIAFLLLNLTYEIDYLISPQGKLTDALERIQQMFFAKNDLSTKERNVQIMDEYEKIMAWPKKQVLEGLYDVKATFALANAANHKTVMDFMFKEREKVKWYRDNNYPQMVDAVYSYMVSYAFFNYGMVYPVCNLLNVVMAVRNPDYYEKCGSTVRFSNDGQLDGTKISKEINAIVSAARKDYPQIAINTGALNYAGFSNFVDSLVLQMDKLNLTKA